MSNVSIGISGAGTLILAYLLEDCCLGELTVDLGLTMGREQGQWLDYDNVKDRGSKLAMIMAVNVNKTNR